MTAKILSQPYFYSASIVPLCSGRQLIEDFEADAALTIDDLTSARSPSCSASPLAFAVPPASATSAAAANRACMLESAAEAVESLAAFLAREGPGVDLASWAAAVRRHVGLG